MVVWTEGGVNKDTNNLKADNVVFVPQRLKIYYCEWISVHVDGCSEG
jgi:hypothetical protein